MQVIDELGLWGGLLFEVRRRLGSRGATYSLNPRHAKHPLSFRMGSSDLDVFRQIFIRLEYGPLRDLQDVRLVIDCGANVGFSSAFFLSHFPSCRVLAIEPDPGNFAMLQRNLRAYGERAEAVRAGVWSHNVPLRSSRDPYRDGREWSLQVVPCEADQEPDFQGLSIPSLLASSGFDRISLLKIDIEGAEVVVFREKTDWLDRVDAIAIELHDDSRFGMATEVFHAAIRGHGFETTQNGGLTICRRKAES